MTNEEIQTVKDTGICHEEELKYSPINVGAVVNGVSVTLKRLTATCQVCWTEFQKTRPETVVLD